MTRARIAWTIAGVGALLIDRVPADPIGRLLLAAGTTSVRR